MQYTARQGVLKKDVVNSVDKLIEESDTRGLFRLFSLKHDFPNEWHRFVTAEGITSLSLEIKKEHFPYFAQGSNISGKAYLFKISDGKSSSLNVEQDMSLPVNSFRAQATFNIIQKGAEVFMIVNYNLSR